MRKERFSVFLCGWQILGVPLLGAVAAVQIISCGGSGSAGTNPPPPPPPPPPTAQSLAIGAPGTAVLAGDQVQLSAVAKYSDGSTKDVTSAAVWSATPASATVSALGVLKASAAGSLTVNATWNSLSASQSFYVSSPLYTPGQNGFNWESVNTQGMGYVTGLVIHPLAPYDMYVRTDVGGAYRFDRGSQHWIPLLDMFGPSNSETYGVESIAVDPTDVNTVYIAVPHGREISGGAVSSPAEVMVSHDKGTTWAPTGLANANIYIGPNDSYRGTTGERLAVDPNDPGILYFASRKDGLWRGAPASPAPGRQWTQISGGLPAPTSSPGVTFVVCDPNGGKTTNGATRNLYTGVTGSGVYASADAGATWTRIAPNANPGRAAMASDGTLIVSFGGDEGATTGSVGRYKAGIWSDITPPGPAVAFSGVAADPVNPKIMMAAGNANQTIFRSADQGATWTQVAVAKSRSYEPAYYPPNSGGWGNAALVIDPANSVRVWQTNGYGVMETEDITAASTTWTWQMANLEELVAMKMKAPPVAMVPGTNTPGADLISVVADMVGLRYASRDIVPKATIDTFQYVAQGSGLTYCAQHPENAAFVGWDETNVATPMSGITADNGLTWKHIPNTTPGSGGKIAMAADNPQNMVWAPINATPAYTTDGGNTWKQATTGGHTLAASWQLSNSWWNADVLAADQVAAGTFYYFDNGNFYSSTDGGATWTNHNVSWPVSPQWTINVNIVPNPLKAGDVWVAMAPNSNQTWTYPLLHSTDGGKTFAAVNGLSYANFVAFGRGVNATTPDIYAEGRAPGDTADAIYRSEDMGSTWVPISDPSRMQLGEINGLEGDMRTRDLVYVALGGRGIMFGYGSQSGITLARRRGSSSR